MKADRTPPVLLRREADLARLVLDRPPQNRMDGAFFDALDRQLGRLDDSLKVLVLESSGRHFSSGAEVDALFRAAPDPSFARLLRHNSGVLQRLAALPQVTVAAVGGACLGSGLELALACDLRVAATNALLGLPEVQFGLIPGCGGTVRLTRLLGRRRATTMILSGGSLLAPEALEQGLVDRVIPRAHLLVEAEKLARATLRRRAVIVGGSPR